MEIRTFFSLWGLFLFVTSFVSVHLLLACTPPVLLCRGNETPIQGRCAPLSEKPEGGTETSTPEAKAESLQEPPPFEGRVEAPSEATQEAKLPETHPESPDTPLPEGTAICTPDGRRCSGATPQVCKADGSGWNDLAACGAGTSCQDGRCTPTGACNGGEVKICYDGPASTQGVGVCKAGMSTCNAGQWGPCVGQIQPGATEICNNAQDDDCDGKIDEGCPTTIQLTGRWHRISDKPPYRYELLFLPGDRYEFFHAGASVGRGDYQLQGSAFQLLDDPGTNCTQSHPTQPWGKYTVAYQTSTTQLKFVHVLDLCFSREGFLTFEEWRLASP